VAAWALLLLLGKEKRMNCSPFPFQKCFESQVDRDSFLLRN
jgi:hypothetical protein